MFFRFTLHVVRFTLRNNDFRKRNPEGRTVSRFAGDGDVTLMGLDDVLDDGEPQACPAGLSGMSFIHAVEPLVPRQVSSTMPMPVSATSTSTKKSSSRADTVTRPPGVLYLMAFSRRFKKIWATADSSPFTLERSGKIFITEIFYP